MQIRKLDFLAVCCLLLEIVALAWFHVLVWQMLLIVVLLPLQTVMMTTFGAFIAFFMMIINWTIKLKYFKFLIYWFYRFVKVSLQTLLMVKLEEKTKWFPKFIEKANKKKESFISNIINRWKPLPIWRRFFYTLSFLPFVILFLLFALGTSETARLFMFKSFRAIVTDALIKLGFKKRK